MITLRVEDEGSVCGGLVLENPRVVQLAHSEHSFDEVMQTAAKQPDINFLDYCNSKAGVIFLASRTRYSKQHGSFCVFEVFDKRGPNVVPTHDLILWCLPGMLRFDSGVDDQVLDFAQTLDRFAQCPVMSYGTFASIQHFLQQPIAELPWQRI